jgi:hypothetical protein
MKTIHIFLASSNELKADREQFEIEIGRKNKLWNVLHLDIWEDSNARMSLTRSQDEYNKLIEKGDVFVLLAHTKVGKYTEEEFETAFGTFQKTKKPFIFTNFKNPTTTPDKGLTKFKEKLNDLGHFYCTYNDFNDLWKQFNKELDRLLKVDFSENDIEKSEAYIDNRNANIKNQFNNGNFNNTTFH